MVFKFLKNNFKFKNFEIDYFYFLKKRPRLYHKCLSEHTPTLSFLGLLETVMKKIKNFAKIINFKILIYIRLAILV